MATEKVTIPDFGNVQEITVVEVYVSVGDRVDVEDPLIALESDKAVMDIPSTAAGLIKEVYLNEDDNVNSGDAVVMLEVEVDQGDTAPSEVEVAPPERSEKAVKVDKKTEDVASVIQAEPQSLKEEKDYGDTAGNSGKYHATPSVRAYARELDVGLDNVVGSGPKGRILKEDIISFIKGAMKSGSGNAPTAGDFASEPLEDFSKYGEVEEVQLGRIKKVSGPHLHKSWVTIPHVTHFDEADVTDLETFRKQMNEEAKNDEPRFSPLVFIIKAVVATLKEFPHFNSSLDTQKGSLIFKHFYNLGIAVDTPNGLVVPAIKDAEKKGMKEIAVELQDLSKKARDGKLAIADMQGATFTISSLGGIGGTGFTPIINAPQVAILGLSRNYLKPVWDGEKFQPRITLPFSLSYDHRVIDGADAARFCKALSRSIEDLRRALL